MTASPDAGRRLRVALGPMDMAGTARALADGLIARGHRPAVIVWRESPYGYRADRLVATRAARLRFAVDAPLSFDVLHGQGGRTWVSYADMILARAAGRTCLIQYNGSDARTPEIAARAHPARARAVDPLQASSVRRHRRLGGRIAHAAVVQDLELATYLLEDYRRIFVVPLAIDLAQIDRVRGTAAAHRRHGHRPLRILHAPSNPVIKGTARIERAVASVAEREAVELLLVSGRPHGEVLGAIAKADLVIDQLNSETTGVLSAEAMALEKPVLCEYQPRMLAPSARGTPVVPVTGDELGARLLELCVDEARRRELGRRGREYVLRVHAPERAAAALERVYRRGRGYRAGVYEARPDGIDQLDLERELQPRPDPR